MTRYLWVFALIPAGYVVALFALYFFQGSLLFFPADVPKTQVRAFGEKMGWRLVPIVADDGVQTNSWHSPARGTEQGVVIYAHGNAGTVFGALEWKAQLQNTGWHVLSVGYRGYPGSDGVPSETGLRQDISAVYAYARAELGIHPEQIVFHGRSLGGGLVGTVMLDLPNGGLIMESTFTSVTDRASELYPYVPVRWLLKHRFETAMRAPDYTQPVLIFHSAQDEVIPVAHGRSLRDQFPKATYVELDDFDHNAVVLGVEETVTQNALSFLPVRGDIEQDTTE